MKNYKGFTLIELLVVIAIIGILASIVVVSLSDQTGKATDATVKATLAQIPAQATVFAGEKKNDGFTNLFQQSDDVGDPAICNGHIGTCNLLNSLSEKDSTSRYLKSTKESWIAAVKVSEGFWCLDSTGAKDVIDSLPIGEEVSCPSSPST